LAFLADYLRADAAAACLKVVRTDLRDQPLEGAAEDVAAEGPAEFEPSHRWIAAKESPKARVAQRVPQIPQVEIGLAVAFTREGQDCVGTCFDAAVNQAREVHAQKRELRIRDRVDQMPHQVLPLGTDLIIFAAKRDDTQIAALARKLGHTIAMQ